MNFDSPEVEAEWAEEITRRVKEVESGEVKGIPSETVFKEARKRLEDYRRSRLGDAAQ